MRASILSSIILYRPSFTYTITSVVRSTRAWSEDLPLWDILRD